jgi:hypothetical protein
MILESLRFGLLALLSVACSSSGSDGGVATGGVAGASSATGGSAGAIATGGSSGKGSTGGATGKVTGSFVVVEQGDRLGVDISSITGFAANDIYLSRTTPVLQPGSVEHYDGTSWRPVFDTTYSIVAMSTTADGKLFACGQQASLFYFDGLDWFEGSDWLVQGPPVDHDYVAIWAASKTDIYAGHDGVGNLYHYDGATWKQQVLPTERGLIPTYAVWGAASNDVYASIYQEGLFHYDGTSWTKVMHPSAIISGIHGRSATDIWAVGTQVLHYDGTSWKQVRAADAFVGTGIINQRYHAVWVSPSGKVWIVGEEGVALFGDQAGLQLVPTGTTSTLFTVWASSEKDVWAGGGLETLVHYTAP